MVEVFSSNTLVPLDLKVDDLVFGISAVSKVTSIATVGHSITLVSDVHLTAVLSASDTDFTADSSCS